MIDPVVHAALIVVFTWLVNLFFGLIGINLGSEAAQALAQVIVAYILSLFGLGLYNRIFRKQFVIASEKYKPPFVS